MRCERCGVNTKCSCRGGGCPVCKMNDRQVSVQNSLLKMGVTKDTLKEKEDLLKRWYNKIDEATLYEYFNGIIDEEKFIEAVQNYKPVEQVARNLKAPYKPLKEPNPTEKHEFDGDSVWSHCKYCAGIKKYVMNKPCSRYIGNIEKEENENEEEKS